MSRAALALLLGAALGGACASRAAAAAIEARISVDASRELGPVNRRVLGNNIQWHNNAERLMDKAGRLAPEMLAAAKRIAPTVLRYPGGTNADTYHWRSGIGPLAQRGESQSLTGSREAVRLGTDELLDLCRSFGAEPLMTVNVATGTAEEAAAWVAYTNTRKHDGPRVTFWEIGNEPYLEARLAEARMTAAEYARRATAFIRAMKAVDPAIQVGIPLRSDTIGGVSGTPYKGWNETVLRQLAVPFDFVSLHSSYYPVTFAKKETKDEMYLATMAGTLTLEEDFEATRAQLRRLVPGRAVKLAVTEYNALYSLDILRWGLLSLLTSKTDRYIESLAGALYVADALRVFAREPDVSLATFWSLTGNWYFGAIDHSAKPRPAFYVLEAFDHALRGVLLATEVRSPTFASPQVGFSAARARVPQVTALSTREGGVLRVIVLNKGLDAPARLTIEVRGANGWKSARLRELNASGPFERKVSWREGKGELRDGTLRFEAGPHSLTVVELAQR